MKDFVKFIKCVLVIAPCVLIVNNSDAVWLNVIGVAYLFCIIGYAWGNKTAMNRMLKDIEEYERRILNGN